MLSKRRLGWQLRSVYVVIKLSVIIYAIAS